jgi:type IX secretion system PorP/SprF family membrane protein
MMKINLEFRIKNDELTESSMLKVQRSLSKFFQSFNFPIFQFYNLLILQFLIFLFVIFNSSIVNCQDIHFSQFTQSPLTNNPAAAGMARGTSFRLIANQKMQWATIGAKYNTSAISFDMPLFKKAKTASHMGLGFYAYTDKAGDSKFGKTQFSLCVSGIVPLSNRSRLSAGIEVGAAQVAANLSTLQWGNQFNGLTHDPNLNSNELGMINSGLFVDMASGLYYEYGTKGGKSDQKIEFNGGLAYYHILQPDHSLLSETDKLYSKIVFQSYFRYDFPEARFSLVPSTIVYWQGPYKEINVGTLVRWRLNTSSKYTVFFDENTLLFGCYYRYKDAIIPQLLLEMGNWGIGFSYDINVSSLSGVSVSRGGIELSLKYLHMNGRALGK